MKKFIAVLLTLTIITGVLVGCQSKPVENDMGEAVTNDTKVVTTIMGDVEVPVDPQRVIVNWYIGDVLSLDLNVVGCLAWKQDSMPFASMLETIPTIEKWEAEELMSYNPDLIITYSPEDFEKFSKVAPVVVLSESEMTPVERLTALGEITGKEKEASARIAAFESSFESAKEAFANPDFTDKTFAILEDWGSDSYGVYYESGSRGGKLIYDYLGLKMPENTKNLIEKTGEGRGAISYEVASEYFGDYVFWFISFEMEESEFAKGPIWNTIPAVQNGNIMEIPSAMNGLFYYSDVWSMTEQMDYFVSLLETIK